jgi:hypothetical protein
MELNIHEMKTAPFLLRKLIIGENVVCLTQAEGAAHVESTDRIDGDGQHQH